MGRLGASGQGKSAGSKGEGLELELADMIMRFRAYCWAARRNKEGKVVEKLAVTNFDHYKWMG